MPEPVQILAFAGSSREGSFNKKLVKIAVQGAAAAGGKVTLIDLRDYPLPVYDGDLEESQGLPENAKKLKKLFVANDGFLISSPEYNSSITGLLKNAIDWVSRKESPDEPPLVCFKGKVVSLMSASPGGLGGLRALVHVRAILENIGALVLPDQVAVPQANTAFRPDGTLQDAQRQKAVEALGQKLVQIISKLKS